MNNSWNKIIYKIWSPIYDRIFNSGSFLAARKEIFRTTDFKSEQKILFVGVGTGADLELIQHTGLQITAIDFSDDMLQQAKAKFQHSNITFLQMDAQQMTFPDETYDVVVASLILSVVPDSNQCFKEIKRVLKQEGEIIIFDKFALKNQTQPLLKKLLRPVIKVLGTDIGLSFEDLFIKNNENLILAADEPIMLKGMYRKIIIRKTKSTI